MAHIKAKSIPNFAVIEAQKSDAPIEGYKLAGDDDYERYPETTYDEENRRHHEIDCFYDFPGGMWDPICLNTDDGRLYLVHFDVLTGEPMIWAEVEKEDAK